MKGNGSGKPEVIVLKGEGEGIAVEDQRRAKEQELINQVRGALIHELELPEVIRTVVEGIAATFGYTQVSVYLLRGDLLTLQHQVGYERTIDTIPISQGVSGKVARTGLPILVDDVRGVPEFIEAIEGVHSELCVPIFDQARVVGVLNVESTDEARLNERDLRLMTALSEHVSIALSRARLYQEVRESEERHRTLVENLGEGIGIVDPSENFIFANPAAEKVFGVPRGTLAGKNLRQFLSEEEYQRTLEETGRRRLGVTSVLEQQIIRPDGTVRRIELTATPQHDQRGTFLHTIGIFRDITDERRIQDQLTQALKMESVGRLAGGVAHDFNNMLGVILGHAHMLLDRTDLPSTLRADLVEIRDAAERSADLTRQLLTFARKQTIAPRPLDLNETVAGMLRMLERLIGENVQLRWQPRAGLWPARLDPSQVNQILANLCVNARDAIADVGRITIETGNSTFDETYCAAHAGCVPGEYVLLAVSDDGRGMNKETLAHLFEPFFTTKGIGKGTGLGLATVYGIVKQNSGFVSVYSEPDHGTSFKIYLPRDAVTRATRTEDAAGPFLRGHETVLLVEDEPSILRLAERMLENRGYKVLAAGTPGEAIRIAREAPGQIHLLMTDVVMPEMNGRNLAKTVLSLHPHIKRLFTSGYTANVIAHHGVLEEGVHFIQKPFSAQELARKVREALDGE